MTRHANVVACIRPLVVIERSEVIEVGIRVEGAERVARCRIDRERLTTGVKVSWEARGRAAAGKRLRAVSVQGAR